METLNSLIANKCQYVKANYNFQSQKAHERKNLIFVAL